MVFYNRLNAVVNYLETHLESKINTYELARCAGINANTLQRLFPLVADITIADYLRYRRLTLAGRDLVQSDFRIVDIAEKYGYTSPAAFSRAFTRFHHIKPSDVKLNASQLKYYPRLTFTPQPTDPTLEYEITSLGAKQLYGISVKTDGKHIRYDAPALYVRAEREYAHIGHPDYGMVIYNNTRYSSDQYEYWVLWDHPAPGLLRHAIPARRWLKFRIHSQKASDIQAMSDLFYKTFLPTCEYELTPDPELEHYHDGVTDFLIPIR